MFDSVSPAESEPIGVVSSGWLRAARCSALICTIALGVGFVAEAAAHDIMVALIFFGRWGSLSLALLYLLFRRGKNSLAFALGLGAATGFIALLAVASMGLARTGLPLAVFRHVLFILAMFSGIMSPFIGEDSPQLARGHRFWDDLAAGRGFGRLVRFRGDGRVCDQLGGWFCGLGLTPPRLAVRWAQRLTCC